MEDVRSSECNTNGSPSSTQPSPTNPQPPTVFPQSLSVPGSPTSSSSTGGSAESSPARSASGCSRFRVPPQTPTLEHKLREGGDAMSESERGLFLDTIYDEVTKTYGVYYPTKGNYETVLEKIFKKYPRMMTPTGNMTSGNKKMLWKHRLLYKFGNKRKRVHGQLEAVQQRKLKTVRRPRPAQTSEPVSLQWGMVNYLPHRDASDDDNSVASHNKWLIVEKKKRQPDYRMVRCCMEKTLADRRKWIISDQPAVAAVKERYPWLFDQDQILLEMDRIKGDGTEIRAELLAGLHKYGFALIQRGKCKKRPHPFFADAVATWNGREEDTDAVVIPALLAIPGELKEGVERIFVAEDAETNSPVFIKLDSVTPGKASEFTLIADGQEVAQTADFATAVSMWISAFYVFVMDYSGCAPRSLEFLQRILLNISDELSPSSSILRLTNLLNVTK